MAWADLEDRVSSNALDAFGESITLGGAARVGIFYPRGQLDPLTTVQAPWGTGTVDAVVRPVLHVAEDLAGELYPGVVVVARGVEYALLRHEADGMGLIACELERLEAEA